MKADFRRALPPTKKRRRHSPKEAAAVAVLNLAALGLLWFLHRLGSFMNRERLPLSKPVAGDVKDQGAAARSVPAGARIITSCSNATP